MYLLFIDIKEKSIKGNRAQVFVIVNQDMSSS